MNNRLLDKRLPDLFHARLCHLLLRVIQSIEQRFWGIWILENTTGWKSTRWNTDRMHKQWCRLDSRSGQRFNSCGVKLLWVSDVAFAQFENLLVCQNLLLDHPSECRIIIFDRRGRLLAWNPDALLWWLEFRRPFPTTYLISSNKHAAKLSLFVRLLLLL